jgi:hypothetical protein
MDFSLLFASAGLVALLCALALALFYFLLREHPSAQLQPRDEAIRSEAEPLPMPEEIGPRCGGDVVRAVRSHPSKTAGVTIEKAAKSLIESKARELGKSALILGWRGREDRESRDYCRVSLRYQIDDERGVALWLVSPAETSKARLEPQEGLSLELTAIPTWTDEAQQRTLDRQCAEAGVEKVKGHFSYMENYNLWRCLRKRAIEVRRETGAEIVYDRWSGVAEGPSRCLVSVTYQEDETPKVAYFRLRSLDNDEYSIEPLTPRAIEVIYGPGVYSR